MQTLTEDDYSAIDMQFDMSHIVNVLTLKYVEKIKVGGKTRKAEYEQTFKDAASVTKYGPKKKTVTVHKKTDFAAYAAAVFAKNADPANVPQSVTVTVCQGGYQSGSLPAGYADGTYVGSKIGIVDPNGGTYTARVRRIEHNITPDTWTMQIFLRNQDVIQPPRTGVSRDTVTSEVANNPDGQVLTAHLEDGAVDGDKLAAAIDGTGKTVTNAVVQTAADGNRIIMRDDGSEGIIEFFPGEIGETAGHINPDATGSIHSIQFLTSHGASSPFDTPGQMILRGSATGVRPELLLVGADFSITGAGEINLDTGHIFTGGDMTAEGILHAAQVFADSPGSQSGSANVRFNTNNQLVLATSLSAHKLDQRPLTLDDARGLLDLTPITWYDRGDVEANDGSTDGLHRIAGVTAEDVEAHAPALAEYDADGNLQGVAYDRMASLLLSIIRDQQERIEALEDLFGRKP